MKKAKQKAICLMSGGIDSSVSAALLQKQGYEVQGLFMHFWSEPGAQGKNLCCSYDAQLNAQAVAQKLGIKLRVISLEKKFKKYIVDYFLKEYSAGHTPNPCVKCNEFIKFGILDDLLGKDIMLATGHYARTKLEVELKIKNFKLLRAKDKNKDQSYFLYNLTQEKLKKIIFPVGDYTKDQVRKMAISMHLPCRTAESFDICFIGDQDYRSFLKKYIKLKPGKIVDQDGKKIGQHQGLAFYTIGQRARLGGGLRYVLQLDAKNNIIITTNNEKDLYSKELIVEKWHWISGKAPEPDAHIQAQIRYHHKPADCKISGKKVIFKKPQRAITPGQSIVIYKNDQVLGGGVIKKT